LTKRQHEILDYLSGYIRENGFAPTFREIAAHFSFNSLATVADHIEALTRKGALTKIQNAARALSLQVKTETQGELIPLLGTIAAGEPIEAFATNETIDVPRDMAGPDVFALKVRGDSMVKDGIFNGDYVVIQKIDQPKNGDIVVALLNGEGATLKRFYQKKDHVELRPANSKYAPIKTKKVLVQGKVKGILRKFK
ncbi:transcriptional repressor LexA, partial [Candidatus Berkelbacteria bacterium]|nr:transcriptional repressor LexA [Candidatus Berkelbacteria bacterium]